MAKRKFRRKKSNREPYFTMDTQEAIVEYCASTNSKEREKVYRDRIHNAFYKLAEFTLRVYKWDYWLYETPYEDAHIEVVSYLVDKMNKFNPNNEKGSTAYSYFNKIAKNFCIGKNVNAYKELKRRDEVERIDSSRDLLLEKHEKESQDNLFVYFEAYIAKLESELVNHFSDRNELLIADAMLEIFKYRENLEDFNKKTIYIMIREMTGVRIETITPVVRKMKTIFDEYKKFYDVHNHLDTSGSFW